MSDDDNFDFSGGKAAAQAYWNALTKLRSAWKEVFGEELPTMGNRAKDAFEQAIDLMKTRLATDIAGGQRLRDLLDIDAKDDVAEVLLNWADMEDVSPRVVKQALLEQCFSLGDGRHELRSLLRPVLDKIFTSPKTRRPRVGANRHWPRLLQYLRELEQETDWSPSGRGIRLMNAGGGGPVAQVPSDPGKLVVKIDAEHI
ncbi:hypothetical protein [Zavarzinia sp.]|uniref:hypothetical protein n=1 Tax=Zavarzinia sp. TaxID=2027920 RepID=UPI003BB6F49B